MKDRKIIKVLSVFSSKELKLFIRFVQSPYFNTSKTLVDLLTYFNQFAPKFTSNKLSVENAFKILYPNKKFDEQVINRQISSLFKLAEEFIVLIVSEKYTIKKYINILEYYKDNQLFPYFESWTNKLTKLNADYVYRDYDYYHHQYLIEYQNATNLAEADNRNQNLDFDVTERAFDIQYWIKKLHILCAKLNRNTFVSGQTIDHLKVEQVIDYLNKSDYLEIPAIQVRYAALKLLYQPDQKQNYDQLKKLLKELHFNLKSEGIQSFYTFLVNCVPMYYESGTKRYEEYFDLFKVQINNGYIYFHGYIHPHILKNVVTVALRLKKYEWAESFLKENKEKILSEESYYWNLANLHYEKGEYSKSQDILLDNKYDDIFYQLGTKRMLVKIYYHLEYNDLLFSFINTFRVFVSRKELNSNQKKRHQNFINFTLKLMKSVQGDSKKLNALLDKIKSTEQLADKNWLIEQITVRINK